MTNKRRDLRIMWNSNGVWTNSGYAVEQKDLLSRLAADGWPMAQIAFWGLQGYPIEKYVDPPFDKGNSIKLYPQMGDSYGTDAMYHHAKDFKADVVFSMCDVPMLNPQFLFEMQKSGIKWIPWLPVDRIPVPPAILANLRFAYKIITFSQFGHDLLQDEGFTSKLILEGTDTSIMKPMDKIEIRKSLNIPPDAFIFGMIAANKENPPRKGYQEALEAFKIFSDAHPEALLFIHTQQIQPGNFPIVDYARYLGIHNKLIMADQVRATFYHKTDDIVKFYNVFDVLLHPSQTEGFGLCVVEAMSCGIPVLVNDCTSMPELIIDGKTGYKCKYKHKFWGNSNAYQFVADSQDLYEKMELLFKDLKNDPKKIAKACRQHVVKKYNIDTLVREEWIPYLENLQEEILGPIKVDDQSAVVTQVPQTA